MAWVRLIEDYDDHDAGEVVDFPAVVARDLIRKGIGVGGRVFDYKPREVNIPVYEKRTVKEQDTVIPDKLKPLDGTVKEIKAFLKDHDIDFKSNARKPELLDILRKA